MNFNHTKNFQFLLKSPILLNLLVQKEETSLSIVFPATNSESNWVQVKEDG
jgi:hypothetical protein